jgi:hypothetical protein
MEKKEYVTPKVLEQGDVKEITLANSKMTWTLDADYPAGYQGHDIFS